MTLIPIADDPAFAAGIDRATKRLDFALFGHWDLPTVARFETAIGAAMARLPFLGIRPGDQVALFDTTRFTVQSPDVLAALGRIASDPRVTSRRIALVLASALLRMQAKRAMPHLAFFDSRDAALGWLVGNEPPPA